MRENVDEAIKKLVHNADLQETYIVGDLISAILKDNANCDMNVVESSKVIAVDSQTKQHQRENFEMQQTPTHYKWSKSVRQRLNLDTSDTALGSSPLMKTFRTVQMNLMESESFIVHEESIDISGQKRLNDPTVPPDEISLNALAAFMRNPEVKILEQLKGF
jgi:hypothetical protein